MAKDEIKARLAGIPVYTVANPKNEFVLVAGEAGSQLGLFFARREDAEVRAGSVPVSLPSKLLHRKCCIADAGPSWCTGDNYPSWQAGGMGAATVEGVELRACWHCTAQAWCVGTLAAAHGARSEHKQSVCRALLSNLLPAPVC